MTQIASSECLNGTDSQANAVQIVVVMLQTKVLTMLILCPGVVHFLDNGFDLYIE